MLKRDHGYRSTSNVLIDLEIIIGEKQECPNSSLPAILPGQFPRYSGVAV